MDIEVRKIILQDSRRMWEIRNSDDVRQVSRNQDKILYEDHQPWFEKKYFSNQENLAFVIEIDGEVAGYCRLDKDEDKFVVSIAIDPDYHGRGLGSQILKESLSQLADGTTVEAEIKKDNIASIKLFEKNNFKKVREEGDYLYFEYQA